VARATHRLSVVIWGLTEAQSIPVTPIGVREIKNCNIRVLNSRLALTMVLLLPTLTEKAVFQSRPLVDELWKEVAQFFLLREMLHIFCSFAHVEGATCGYLSDNATSSILANRTFDAMRAIVKNGLSLRTLQSMTFFSANVASTQKMMRMWARMVEIHSSGSTPLLPLMTGLFVNPVNSTQIPTQSDLKELYTRVRSAYGSMVEHQLRLMYPVKVSSIPAEVVLRGRPHSAEPDVSPLPPIDRSLRVSTLRYDFRNTKYPMELVIPVMADSVILSEVTVTHKPESLRVRVRADHSYRLYGTISTAFNKILEICLHEDLDIKDHSVCLAEGEGSVAYLLQKMSNSHIYFNTLVESGLLIPQRGSSYTPAACMRIAEKIHLASYSALNGGDITDADFIQHFVEQVPQNPSVVTCDAESTTAFSPKLGMKIVTSWCYTCASLNTKSGIIKLFCNNTQFLMCQVGTICSCFHKVKIVVPHFSSYEGFEIYVVATTLRNLVQPNEYLTSLREGLVFPMISSYWSLRDPLQHLLDVRSSRRSHPFADSNFHLVTNLWELSVQYEIHDNISRVLDRISLGILPFEGSDIGTWIKQCRALCTLDATAILRGHYHAYSAQDVSRRERLLLGKSKVIHSGMDKYATGLLNLNVLEAILSLTNWVEVYPTIANTVADGVQVMSGEVVMYTYAPELHTWSKQFLKPMWRVWGHWFHHDAHNCPVNWVEYRPNAAPRKSAPTPALSPSSTSLPPPNKRARQIDVDQFDHDHE